MYKIRFIFSLLIFCLFCLAANAQTGHHISVKLKNYVSDTLRLGYYYGEKQYVSDTAVINKKGEFVFSGEEELKPGLYMLVMNPDNNFFQLIINSEEQFFQVEADAVNQLPSMKFKGSEDNELYYSYLQFLDKQKLIRDEMEKEKKELMEASQQTAEVDLKLEKLDKEVVDKQKEIVEANPDSYTATLIKASYRIDLPEFQGTDEEIQTQNYRFYKKHYFDHIDIGDPRLLRSQVLFQRFEYYVEKLTPQIPDSINQSLDYLLKLMEPAPDTYRFYLVHFLNKYAASKFVGMDAVYVHLVDEYYAKGKAPWVEEEALAKMIKNAATTRPILIGKVAPDLKMRKRDNSFLSLHEVESDFLVMFFWDPECGHCKKSIPKIKEFYKEYNEKGVEIFSICTKIGEKASDCWDSVDEKEIGEWINVNDQYLRSRFKQIYDIRTTPRIFILDKDKKIVSKGIGAEQLPQMLEHLMQKQAMEQKSKEGEK